MKKLAYLILAYSDPIQLTRLVEAIDYNCDFYIHIDNKSDINLFNELEYKSNVKFSKIRSDIYWGGFNMILATKELIKEALDSKEEYSHLILLSGNDYPIKNKEYIYNYFIKKQDKEIIRGYFIEDSNCPHCYNKIQKYRFFDKKNCKLDVVYRKVKTYLYSPFKKKIYIKIDNEIIKPCYGSQWWALTPSCAKYILEYLNKHKEIDKYFKTSFAPDEMYFHTIIFNSQFAEKTIKNGVEKYSSIWKWNNNHFLLSDVFSCKEVIKESLLKILKKVFNKKKDYSGSVEFLNLNNFNEIKESQYLFARKFSTNISTELMDKIDTNILNGGKMDNNFLCAKNN